MISPGELWEGYNTALEESPLLIKSLTAGVILGTADLAGQAVESTRDCESIEQSNSEGGVDVARAVRFAIFGLVLQAVRLLRAANHRRPFSTADSLTRWPFQLLFRMGVLFTAMESFLLFTAR